MKSFEEFVTNAKTPIEHLFQNHTFCDESWCYAKSISQKLHNAIGNSVRNKDNDKNTNTTHLLDSQEVSCGDHLMNSPSTKVFHDEPSYDELEQLWVHALDLDTTIFEDGDGDDNEEYISTENDNGDSDKEVVEVESEMVDELNYELAICDVLDDYHIDRMVFAESESEDLKVKEKKFSNVGIEDTIETS